MRICAKKQIENRKEACMRHNIILVFLFSITLLAFASAPAPALGQEAPSVSARANAPGWITVYWEHSGADVYWFEIERQDPPYRDDSVVLLAKSYNRTDSLTDKNLKADTTYKYRVCAVYAYSRTCQDWLSVRTLPPPPPSSGGSSGGTSSPPKHQLRTPNLTATTNSPVAISLHWGSDSNDLYTLGNVQLYRDGRVTFDVKEYGGFTANYEDGGRMYHAATKQWTGQSLRANTEYIYKVCFIGFADANGETKCSNEITAMGKPIPPTPLADVALSKDRARRAQSARGMGRVSTELGTIISASWHKTSDPPDIPGQYITMEREDRTILSRGPFVRVGLAWIELKRIKAKGDPTVITVDVTPEGPEIGTDKPGNIYRVCAVVPALGAGGKVCSSPWTLP